MTHSNTRQQCKCAHLNTEHMITGECRLCLCEVFRLAAFVKELD